MKHRLCLQVVLFAVPGAFTPTCSSKHLPGFIEKAEEFKAKGVDTLACVSVNDAFVMDAWGKSAGIDGKILMLADGSAEFAKVGFPSQNFQNGARHALLGSIAAMEAWQKDKKKGL